jgi:hypothetical protein
MSGVFERGTDADGPGGAIEEPYVLFAVAFAHGPQDTKRYVQASSRVRAGVVWHVSGRISYDLRRGGADRQILVPGPLAYYGTLKDQADAQRRIRSNHPVSFREAH